MQHNNNKKNNHLNPIKVNKIFRVSLKVRRKFWEDHLKICSKIYIAAIYKCHKILNCNHLNLYRVLYQILVKINKNL